MSDMDNTESQLAAEPEGAPSAVRPPKRTSMLDDPRDSARLEAARALWQITHDTNLISRITEELERQQTLFAYPNMLIDDRDKDGRNFSAGFAAETLAIWMLAVKAVGKRQAIRATAGVIRQAFVHKSIDMAGPTQCRIRKRAGELHRNTPLPD